MGGVLVFADNIAGPRPDLKAHLIRIVVRETKRPISYNVRLENAAEDSAASFLYSPQMKGGSQPPTPAQ
jgi:hypothetical protein